VIVARTSRVSCLVAKGKLELQELPIPAIGPDEGLLRVERAGICGSDVLQFHGDTNSPYPTIPGHEPVGTIDEIGERAAETWGVRKGDRVIVQAPIPCLRCGQCHAGAFDTCRNKRVIGRTSTDVAPGLWGAYSEYLYLHPNTRMRKISPSVPLDVAATFNALAGGVEWTGASGVTLGDTVLVLGAGQRGLACVVAAKMRGAGTVIITGLSRDRHKLDVALELGADHVIDVEVESVVERVREITDGAGADIVMDLVPYATETIVDAIDCVRPHGMVFIAGRKGPTSKIKNLVVDKIVQNGLRVQGTHGKSPDTFRQVALLLESERFPLHRLPTHTFPLEEATRAIETLAGTVPGEHAICVSLAIGD
jgi:threonine dehydrogenase-like Zn-dependent dehydrogenase